MSTTAYDTVNANAKTLLQFVSYFNDIGIRSWLMMELVSGGEITLEEASQLIDAAIHDIIPRESVGPDDSDEVLTSIVDGAVSLSFLSDLAKELDGSILPAETVPSDEVIEAALELFNARRKLTWLDDYVPSFRPQDAVVPS